MKCNTKQVAELAEIDVKEGWIINDLDGLLVKGVNSAMMVNALTAYLASGYYIVYYARSFSDNTLRIFIDK